jgi:hypothetical protein
VMSHHIAISISTVLINSEPFTFMSRTMVCNTGRYGDFGINLYGTLDSPSWEF